MTTAILLRTYRFGPRDAEFLATLETDSGCRVHVLADETRGAVDTGRFAKISMTPAKIRAMSLPAPADFGWRCGDYGFYLARRALPDIAHFWMIEPDVRARVTDYADIFASLATCDGDFLAPNVIPSSRAHFWWPTMRWVTPHVFRCDFAFSRMSVEAADICLAERRRLARTIPARIMWPNDETFVTTTLRRLGRSVADVNSCGRTICTPESFGFFNPHRGEELELLPQDGLLYHPVLWGEDYERKRVRVAQGASFEEALRLKILRGLIRAQEAAGMRHQEAA
jgi:hypothetical protein